MFSQHPTIARFFQAVEPIGSKNSGGCLFFCYAFWKWLEKNNLPKQTFQIVQYDHGTHNTVQNLIWIEDKGRSNIACSSFHFTWLYQRKEYDGNGRVTSRQVQKTYKPFVGEPLKRTVLEGLNLKYHSMVDTFCVEALREGDWNWMFERDAAVKIIKEKLDLDLSHVGYESIQF